jgi:hypothetical protein
LNRLASGASESFSAKNHILFDAEGLTVKWAGESPDPDEFLNTYFADSSSCAWIGGFDHATVSQIEANMVNLEGGRISIVPSGLVKED